MIAGNISGQTLGIYARHPQETAFVWFWHLHDEMPNINKNQGPD